MANESGGTLVVAGATSVATQHLIDIVSSTPNWNVIGLCRNPPPSSRPNVRYAAADFLDPESCKRAVEGVAVTHLVYAARARHTLYTAMMPHAKVGIENVEPNLNMLRNITAACSGPTLRHVHALAGTKWYGLHFGPFPTPARESDPGHMPPNFYFDQQNFLIEESARAGWSWSTSRPGIISGETAGGAPNMLASIGVYAAICRHLGLPLEFPGKPGAYTSLLELTEARQLAEAIFWMCRTPEAANQAFNITNGDLFRWEHVWSRLADHFGMKAGPVRHFSLVQWMADKGPVWDEIVKQHGLQPLAIDQVASWGFADFTLNYDYDVISSMTKIRLAGFHRTVDTEAMMLDQLSQYRQKKFLP
ncbi:SDR family oxidoreductase [Castellaniella denitrificans]|jgi:nucleoside-diphosphate-sugar epimerase|uniref:SDR family oxidoreductase n=1 Tax=Castellaniella denitrificans TaxID=56119 RepID=UPI003614DF35